MPDTTFWKTFGYLPLIDSLGLQLVILEVNRDFNADRENLTFNAFSSEFASNTLFNSPHRNLPLKQSSQSLFPRPMAHWAAPISVSIALGHASTNAVKATAGGCSTGTSASLTFPLHSHMSSARRESSEYHF